MPVTYPTTMTAEKALAGVQGLPLGVVPMGRIFWVDSTHARAIDAPLLGAGEIDRPFATIAYACGRCVDNRGDVVMVKRNHYEVIEAATDWDGAGITIIGEGPASKGVADASDPITSDGRPLVAIGETVDAARVLLTGIGAHVHGIDFMALGGVAAGTQRIIEMNASGQIISGCRIFPSVAGADILVPLYVNATDCIIAFNLITQKICSGAQEDMIRLVSAHRTQIIGNRLIANTSNRVFEFTTTAPQDIVIAHNRIEQHGSPEIVSLLGATGLFAYNGIYHQDAATAIDSLVCSGPGYAGIGSLACIGNYLMNADGESGGIVPGTVST